MNEDKVHELRLKAEVARELQHDTLNEQVAALRKRIAAAERLVFLKQYAPISNEVKDIERNYPFLVHESQSPIYPHSDVWGVLDETLYALRAAILEVIKVKYDAAQAKSTMKEVLETLEGYTRQASTPAVDVLNAVEDILDRYEGNEE